MSFIDILQWISVGLSITGMVLVTYKIRIGFLFWVIASLTWLYIFHIKGVGPRMVVESVYAISAGYGFYRWGIPDKEKKCN